MIPIAAAMIGSQLIGGIMAGQAGQAAAEDAERMRKEAMAMYANIPIPDTEKMKLYLEQMQSAGQLSPELEQALTLGPSAMEQISVDPRLKQSQMDALEQVSGLAKTGLSDADMASLELVRRQAAGEAQAKQGQILQQMQARGQGGSGAELIAKLQAGQSGADMVAQQGLEEAKLMQQARMQALRDQANMSTSIRGQQFGEDERIAQSKDLINRYNAENMQRTSGRNVDRKNQAQQGNLQNQQRILDQNVALRNQQQQYNKELQQREYENRLRKVQGTAGQMQNIADDRIKGGAAQAGAIAGITQGVGTAIGTLGKASASDNSDYKDARSYSPSTESYSLGTPRKFYDDEE